MIYKKHFLKKLLTLLLIIIISTIVFASCNSSKNLITKTLQNSLKTNLKNPIKLIISPNSTLFVSKDTFKIYNVVQKKGPHLLLKFTYKTQAPKNLADANYSEILFIEIPNYKQSIHLTSFKNINVWFARFCYCKDYVGYHRILNGDLNLILNKKTLKINMRFSFNNIPQVLNFIDQKIILKP